MQKASCLVANLLNFYFLFAILLTKKKKNRINFSKMRETFKTRPIWSWLGFLIVDKRIKANRAFGKLNTFYMKYWNLKMISCHLRPPIVMTFKALSQFIFIYFFDSFGFSIMYYTFRSVQSFLMASVNSIFLQATFTMECLENNVILVKFATWHSSSISNWF
jgi:hypothetical protein